MTPRSLPELETKAFHDAILAALRRSGLAAQSAIGSSSPEQLAGVVDLPRAGSHADRRQAA
jgi:hypothetical protein